MYKNEQRTTIKPKMISNISNISTIASRTLGLRNANPFNIERIVTDVARFVDQDVTTMGSPTFKSITVDALNLTKGGTVTELQSNAVQLKSNFLNLQDIDDSTDLLADTTGINFYPGASLYYDIATDTFRLKKQSQVSPSLGSSLLTLSSSSSSSPPSPGFLAIFDESGSLTSTDSLDVPISMRKGLTVSNDFLEIQYGAKFSTTTTNTSTSSTYTLDINPLTDHLELAGQLDNHQPRLIMSWEVDGSNTHFHTDITYNNGSQFYSEGSDLVLETFNQGTFHLVSTRSALNGGAFSTEGGIYCGSNFALGYSDDMGRQPYPSYSFDCHRNNYNGALVIRNADSTISNNNANTVIRLDCPNGRESGWVMQAGSDGLEYRLSTISAVSSSQTSKLILQATPIDGNSSVKSQWDIEIDQVRFLGIVDLNNITPVFSLPVPIECVPQYNCVSAIISPISYLTRINPQLGSLKLKIQVQAELSDRMVFFYFSLPFGSSFTSQPTQNDLLFSVNGSIYNKVSNQAIATIYDALLTPIASSNSVMVSFTPFHSDDISQTIYYLNLEISYQFDD